MTKLMKKNMGKKLMVFMVMFAIISSVVPVKQAQAAAPKFPKTIEMKIYPNCPDSSVSYGTFYNISYPTAKGKVTQLKSSNTEVATVSKSKDINSGFFITPKSVGTTKVTFKYAGKKFTSKVNVTNYENPFTSIKIGNKNFTKYFNVSNHYALNKQKKNLKGKLRLAVKKGWKIKSIKVFYGYIADTKKVKNNSNVTIKSSVAGGTTMSIQVQNTKTKEKVLLQLDYTNNPYESSNFYFQPVID